MKVALSGMVLGASMLGANGASLGTTAYTFSDGSSLTLSEDQILTHTGSELECKPGYEIQGDMANQGNAYRDYQTADLPIGSSTEALRSGYESGNVLTYYCGVPDGQGGFLAGGSPNNPTLHKDNNRIRVDLSGSCSQAAEFVDADTTVVDSYNDANPILDEYQSNIAAKIDFKCKQPVGFAPKIDAALKFVQKTSGADAATIAKIVRITDIFGIPRPLVASDVTKSDLSMSSTDGQVFSMSSTEVFSLGTTRAHPDYYESGGCNSDQDLCKGALRFTLKTKAASRASDTTLVKDRTTSLVDAANFHPQRPQFVQCKQDPISNEQTYKLFDACYPSGYASTTQVNGTLLEDLVCPFSSPNKPDSTSSSVAECVADGEVDFDNTCAGIEARISLSNIVMDAANKADVHTQELTSVIPGSADKYQFKYQFLESKTGAAQRFQDISDLDSIAISGDSTTILSADETSFTYSISLGAPDVATIQSKASDFFVKANVGGSSWMRQVVLSETITVEGIPSIATNIQLFGQVYTTCSKAETALSATLGLGRQTPLKETGRFEQVATCSDRYLYVRGAQDQDAALTVDENVFGTEGTGKVKICLATHDATDAHCQEDGGSSLTLRANDGNPVYAHITGTCDNIKNGVYGGLVEFEEANRVAAPILCKGTCTNAVMHDLHLDWRVEFAISSQAGPEHNKLVADQVDSSWQDPAAKTNGDKYFTARKFAYLINPDSEDECGADGTTKTALGALEALSADTSAGGCLVYKQETNADGSWGAGTEDTGLNTGTDVQNWLAGCGAATDGGAKAKLVQRFSVDYDSNYVDQNTSMTDESFCHVRDLEVTVQTLLVGSVSAQLDVAQVSDPTAATRLSTNIGNVQYEQCGGTGFRIKAYIDVDADDLSSAVWAEDASTSSIFYDTFDASAKTVTWISNCEFVCDGSQGASDILATWNHADGHTLAGKISRTSTSASSGDDEVSFSFNVNLQGDPCNKDAGISAGDVELSLYKVDPADVDTHTCSISDAISTDNPQSDGGFCGRIALSNMGNFEFTILDTMVTRETPGSEPIFLCEKAGDTTNDELCVGDARGQLFLFGADDANNDNTNVAGVNGAATLASNNVFKLDPVDAFGTIKYTIFWKQQLNTGGRRLLRSEHVFGSGEKSSVASLVVLPASAQIEDAVESMEAGKDKATNSTEPSSDDSDDSDDDDGLSGGYIALIITGSVFVVGGIAYVAVQAQGERRMGRPAAAGYSKVRRNERFSTMNF